MSKSTKQLREDLALAVVNFRAADSVSRQQRTGTAMAEAAEALLGALNSQVTRSGKPFRVTFQHQSGSLAGRVFHESRTTLGKAVETARVPMAAGARIEISVRNTDGTYTALSVEQLRQEGWPEFAEYALYGDAHHSQEV